MAKTIPVKELIKQYEFVCNEWVNKFSNKHGLEFSGWVGDSIGEVAVFIDQYFFNLSDIILDIKTKQPKGLILQWQDDEVEYALLDTNNPTINYKSYTMGLRHNQLKK